MFRKQTGVVSHWCLWSQRASFSSRTSLQSYSTMPPKKKVKPDKNKQRLNFFTQPTPPVSSTPIPSTSTQEPESDTPPPSAPAAQALQADDKSETCRKFVPGWAISFKWVRYDANTGCMYYMYTTCESTNMYNSFTTGCSDKFPKVSFTVKAIWNAISIAFKNDLLFFVIQDKCPIRFVVFRTFVLLESWRI